MIERKAPGAFQPVWVNTKSGLSGYNPASRFAFKNTKDLIRNCPGTYARVANASGRISGDSLC